MLAAWALSDYKTGSPHVWRVWRVLHSWQVKDHFCRFRNRVGVYSPLQKANLIPPLSTPHNLAVEVINRVVYHRLCNKGNMTDASNGAGTDNPSSSAVFTHGFLWYSCCSQSLVLCVALCRSLFVLLSIVCSSIFGFMLPLGIFCQNRLGFSHISIYVCNIIDRFVLNNQSNQPSLPCRAVMISDRTYIQW